MEQNKSGNSVGTLSASYPGNRNPFTPLITECNDNATKIQAKYTTHRSARNAQQREKILASDFQGWNLDSILAKLDGPDKDPNFVDPRHCVTIWGKPPMPVQRLVETIQHELRTVAPSIWLMPLENLHITILEIAFSKTKAEVEDIVSRLGDSTLKIVNYTNTHRLRLIKPLISYDSAGLALSFVPAAGELKNAEVNGTADDRYTYHHLRRDIFDMAHQLGVKTEARYNSPSAHLTLARFITQDGFLRTDGDGAGTTVDRERVKCFMKKIEELNTWLEAEYWPRPDGTVNPGGDWIMGEEKGLTLSKGTVWYGGGEQVMVGTGFSRFN